MPVVAVAGAAVAIGVAAEVGTTLAIVAAVGATIGAVGAVTGVKELQIAGAVIGLVGGIGALAQGAGLLGDIATLGSQGGSALADTAAATTAAETASPFSGISDVAGGVTAMETATPFAGAPSLASSVAEPTTTTDIVGAISGEVTPYGASGLPADVSTNMVSPDVTPTAATDTGLINSAQPDPLNLNDNSVLVGDDLINTPKAPSVKAPGDPMVTAGTQPDPNAVTVTGQPDPLLGKQVGGADLSKVADPIGELIKENPAPKEDGDSLFGNLWKFTKSNGTLLSGLAQAGGSFLAGATSSLTPAQVAALHAQAEANQAAANMSQMQQSNLSQALPTARRVTGMINRAAA